MSSQLGFNLLLICLKLSLVIVVLSLICCGGFALVVSVVCRFVVVRIFADAPVLPCSSFAFVVPILGTCALRLGVVDFGNLDLHLCSDFRTAMDLSVAFVVAKLRCVVALATCAEVADRVVQICLTLDCCCWTSAWHPLLSRTPLWNYLLRFTR